MAIKKTDTDVPTAGIDWFFGAKTNKSGAQDSVASVKSWYKKVGGFYMPVLGCQLITCASGLALGVSRWVPIDMQGACEIDALSFYIMANSPSTWQLKCAIYDVNESDPTKPDGSNLLAEGSVIGNGGGVTSQSNQLSTLAAPVRLPQYGRGWLATKMSVSLNAANQLLGVLNIGLICGGNGARELGGFTSDPLKCHVNLADTYAAAWPAIVPATTRDTANIAPIGIPRISAIS